MSRNSLVVILFPNIQVLVADTEKLRVLAKVLGAISFLDGSDLRENLKWKYQYKCFNEPPTGWFSES